MTPATFGNVKRTGTAIALLAATLFSLPSAAEEALLIPAQLVIEDVGASERVDYSGRLRLLGQAIAAGSCFYLGAGGGEEAKSTVLKSVEAFDKILAALRNGDESLGIIGPEKRTKTLMVLDDLAALWEPYRTAAAGSVSGENAEQHATYLAENNMALLAQAVVLASDINAEYANPAEMMQANALVIDITGRQGMLTQKMLKEACGVETANPGFGSAADLQATLNMFDASLNALVGGMPDAGVMAPPSPEIEAAVRASVEEWAPLKAGLQQVIDTGDIPDEKRHDLFIGVEALRETMTKLTVQYREAAVQGL
ncbi:MAG: hypothetical protein HC844_11970 [Tabrizicola sp.]|nr:hypothetical protein [Tabrizicola sp.]